MEVNLQQIQWLVYLKQLDLALTNSAMPPATYKERDNYGIESGKAVMNLIEKILDLEI